MPRSSRLLVISILLAALLAFVGAGTALAQDEGPIVYGVLFYSPTCPHCAVVIEETLPELQEEFGPQLQLLLINTAVPQGGALLQSTYDHFQVPDSRWGVPTMIIGSDVLVGSLEIPALSPGLIRAGLDAGGLELPGVPGLREAYDAALAAAGEPIPSPIPTASDQATAPGVDPQPSPTPVHAAGLSTEVGQVDLHGTASESVLSRLTRDPLGNSLAVVVLLGLIGSLGVVLAGWSQTADRPPGEGRMSNWMQAEAVRRIRISLAAFALLLSMTLIFDPDINAAAVAMAVLMATGLALILSILLVRRQPDLAARDLPTDLVAFTALVGMIDAAYLSTVELSGASAVCGIIGDCNAVQTSTYAMLFGVLPVGFLGLFGNFAVLLMAFGSRYISGTAGKLARAGLLGMALIGTALSIYLTALEPFVIGATCIWCLTSAVLMALLLWLSAPSGRLAVRRLLRAG